MSSAKKSVAQPQQLVAFRNSWVSVLGSTLGHKTSAKRIALAELVLDFRKAKLANDVIDYSKRDLR